MPNGRRRQSNTRHANRQRHLQSVRAEAVVDEAPPVVIQAEAVTAENRYSEQSVQEALEHIEREHQREMEGQVSEIKGMEEAMDDIAQVAGVPEDHEYFGHFRVTIDEIERMKDQKKTSQRVAKQFMDKYEKAKAGTLLGFQEVELEDKEKEINDLTYMLEKTMDKLQDTLGKLKQSCEENKKILNDGQKAFFLYHIVQNTAPEDGAHIHIGNGKVVKVLTKKEAEVVQREVESDEGGRRLTREEIMEVMGIQ